jgi:hypothetical protein
LDKMKAALKSEMDEREYPYNHYSARTATSTF